MVLRKDSFFCTVPLFVNHFFSVFSLKLFYEHQLFLRVYWSAASHKRKRSRLFTTSKVQLLGFAILRQCISAFSFGPFKESFSSALSHLFHLDGFIFQR